MKIKILSLILLVLFAVGCATMPAEKIEDLKEKIMKANMDINSFKFKSVNKMTITKADEAMDMLMSAEGAMDRAAKRLKVTGDMKMGEMELPIETYADGQYVYTNNMGQWIKMKIEQDMFEMQDQSKYLTDFLKDSEILAEEAEKDGKPVYKVQVTPTKEALLDLAQKSSPVPLQDELNLEELFKSMEITYYINKDNFLAEKADIKYSLKIDDVTMSTVSDYEMFDVDKPVDITIPEAAKDAMDFEEFQKQVAEQMAAQQADLPVDEDLEIETFVEE